MQLFPNSNTFEKKRIWTQKWLVGMLLLLFSGGLMLFLSCNNSSSGSSNNVEEDEPQTYSLSGTISLPGNTTVDSDVNDAWEGAPLPQSNNSFEEAQEISVPVILGGFVTEAQSSECPEGGRLCADGDESDFYKVNLNGDKTITLYVPDNLDASLHLYDADQTPLEPIAIGFSETLTLSITDANGDYYIEVRAQRGASNYTMTVASSSTTSTDGSSLSADQDFVPGEFIVRFKDDGNEFKSASGAVEKAQALGLNVATQTDNGPVLVQIQDNMKTEVFDKLNMQCVIQNMNVNTADNSRRNAKLETIQVINAMRKRSDVLYAEPNYIRYPLAIIPNDEYYDAQWHYPLINLPDAWDEIPLDSSPVVVAVVDTGVLTDHPDLEGQLTSDGYDFISDITMANDGDGRDNDPYDPGDENFGGSSSYHGTHVSGTIAAASNNSIGVAGVTWQTDTRIMPLRAMGVGGGTSSDIIEAVKYAAGLENSTGLLPGQPADVINLSIGGSSFSNAEKEVYAQARAQGVIIVAAAGNDNSTTPIYPAAYDSVISVNAVDINSELAYYSNYGATISVAAPGGDLSVNLNGDNYVDGVLSTIGDDLSGSVQYNYGFYDGTSMATPHMAGVAALMKAVAPDLTPDDFDAHLINGDLTVDIGDTGKDNNFGYGLIDAYKSVLSAQNLEIPVVLKVSPATLDFGSEETSKTLTAQILGTGSLNITSVSSNADWVTVTPTIGDLDSESATSLNFQVQIERPNDFLDNTYTATITFTYETSTNTESADSLTTQVQVSMQKISSDQTSDAGYHYIVLYDSNTLEPLEMVEASVQNGKYTYQFNDIEAGNYLIFAGTDMDNDGQIGEAGEAAGAYPSLSQLKVISVNENVSEIDFSSGFEIVLSDELNSVMKLSNENN